MTCFHSLHVEDVQPVPVIGLTRLADSYSRQSSRFEDPNKLLAMTLTQALKVPYVTFANVTVVLQSLRCMQSLRLTKESSRHVRSVTSSLTRGLTFPGL